MTAPKPLDTPTQDILKHWREAVPNDRLAHLVKDAARALLRALQMRLAQHAVSLGHWTFLRILWEADGITQRELSVQAGVMEPTTYAALNAMEKLGYVLRRHKPDNRKNVYVYLTPEGRKLKSVLVPLAVELNAVAVKDISEADVATTRRTLLAILENIATDEDEVTRRNLRMPSTRELGRRISRGRALKSAEAARAEGERN